MEDPIFIKENSPANTDRRPLIIIGIIVVAVIAILGYLALSNNSATRNNNNSTTNNPPASTPVNSTSPSNTNNTNKNPNPVTTPPADVADDEDSDVTTPAADDQDFSPPADPTKLNVYYLKTGASGLVLSPALRDKPATSIESFIINQLFIGPNAEEKASGLKVDWTFGNESTCGAGKSYKFTMSGTSLRLDLCRAFTGADPANFVSATTQSLTETGRVSKVSIITPAGDCLGKPTGDTSCL